MDLYELINNKMEDDYITWNIAVYSTFTSVVDITSIVNTSNNLREEVNTKIEETGIQFESDISIYAVDSEYEEKDYIDNGICVFWLYDVMILITDW